MNNPTPVDYIDLCAWDSDGTNIYGSQNGVASKYLAKQDLSGNKTTLADTELLTDQTTGSYPSVAICSGSTVFIVVRNASNQSFLYKSVNGGVNFGDNAPDYNNGNWVDRIGWDGTSHVSAVTILGTRGFLTAADGTLYYGEYNTNGTRTPGSTNDRVGVRYSTDNGDTWQNLFVMNTDGSTRQTTHCHAVRQDPYTNEIYFCFGDGETNSGIIQWDRSATITDNATFTALNNIDGIRTLSGSTQYQTTDLLFTADYIFNPADDGGAVAETRGIWRYNKTLTDITRVSSGVTDHTGHAMYWGVKLPNGSMVATELLESTATDFTLYVYTSTDDGSTWTKSGKVLLRTDATSGKSVQGLFTVGNNIYYGLTRGAGKDAICSAVFELSGDNISVETLHPVYWVDPSGTDGDAPNGYNPGSPYATIKYAVESNRMTYGAKLKLAPGLHESQAANLLWQANTRPAITTTETVIEGTEGQTILIYDTAHTGAGFTLEASDGDIQFRKMRVISYNNSPLTTSSGYDGTLTENVVKGLQKWKD